MESEHGREFAIAQLEEWYDKMNVLPKNRIKSELLPEEEEEVLREGSDDIDADKITDAEKFDVTREAVIKAFQSKRLILNEEKELQYKLQDPIKKKSGEILHESVTFKRYRRGQLTRNLSGLGEKDMFKYVDAKLATRVGLSRGDVELLFEEDHQVMSSVDTLFLRVG